MKYMCSLVGSVYVAMNQGDGLVGSYDLANPSTGGAIQSVIAGYTCRFPPYDTSSLSTNYDPADPSSQVNVYAEMAVQCYKMNGFLIEDSHCARQTDAQKCEAADGWIYFDEWCYRKFDYSTEANFFVKRSMEPQTCAQLGTDVAVFTPGIDITAWIQNVFVYWNHGETGYPYRMYMEGDFCVCFDWIIGGDGNPTSSYSPCNCNNDAFPICRYPWTSRPLIDSDIDMSPQTRALLRDGQTGLPWSGGQMVCSTCELGSGGEACQKTTCSTYLDLNDPTFPNTTAEQSVLGQAFALCNLADHGYCDDNNPRVCQCEENYGPPASFTPGSIYYQFMNITCQCPAGYQPRHTLYPGVRGWYANDVLYTFPLIPICGGMDRGKCYTQPGSGMGYCGCIYRIVPASSISSIQYEPAYNGKSCSCPVAVKMATGYADGALIEEGFCNGAGACCESGEIQENVIVDGMDVGLNYRLMCYVNNTPINGCSCYNGMTGVVCTCVARYDEAQGLVVTPSSGGYLSYVQFPQPLPIVRVEVTTNTFYNSLDDYIGCTPTYVKISQSLQGSGITCAFVTGNGWSTVDHYECDNPSNTEMVFVIVGTVEVVGNCNIKAYILDFNPCGYHTNPRAARFMANEKYQGRDFLIFKESVNVQYATFGCTPTECMCNSNYTGPSLKPDTPALHLR